MKIQAGTALGFSDDPTSSAVLCAYRAVQYYNFTQSQCIQIPDMPQYQELISQDHLCLPQPQREAWNYYQVPSKTHRRISRAIDFTHTRY